MAIEIANKRLEPGDKVEKNWPAQCDGRNGYIVLSKRKLLFIEEKGFLRMTYNLILDIPYEKIDKITVEYPRKLTLTEEGGRRHNFTSGYVSDIEESLKGLTKRVMPTA